MIGTVHHSLLTLLVLVLLAPACRSLPEGVAGTEVRQGDIGVTVAGYELRYLDLQAESGAVVTTDRPVLLIRLSVTNYSAAAVRYDTRDSATSGQQALTPLLFVDSGSDEEWRTQANNVPLVSLGQFRYLDDPLSGLVTLGAGETINDVILFESPREGTTALILSLPPTMFGAGAETPVIIRIPYSAPEPIRPPVVGLGEEAQGDGYTFRLDSAEIAYWPNEDRSGFTERPLLGLRYAITNTTDAPIRYDPPHRDQVGDTAPLLTDGSRRFSRVSPPSRRQIAGQLSEPVMLAPGDTVTDLGLFDRPDQSVEALLLQFPGRVLGRNGQVRVRFVYTFSDPPLPEELRAPQPVRPAPTEGETGGTGPE